MAAYDNNEVDHSLFKMNNLRTFNNDDKDKLLSFGCFAGKMTIVISRTPYVRGVLPTNIPVSPELRYEISKTLKNLLEHPVPNAKFPIKIVGWTQKDDGKYAKEIRTVLSFGIDERGIGFIAAKVNGDSAIDVKVSLTGPRTLENEDYADPISATVVALEELKYFVDSEWAIARLFTTNDIRGFKPKNGSNPQASSTVAKPVAETDGTDYF